MSNGIMNTLMHNVKVNEMLEIELDGWQDKIVENYDGKESDLTLGDMTINEVISTLIEMVAQEQRVSEYQNEIVNECNTIDVPMFDNADEEMKYNDFVKSMNLKTATAYYHNQWTIDPFNQM